MINFTNRVTLRHFHGVCLKVSEDLFNRRHEDFRSLLLACYLLLISRYFLFITLHFLLVARNFLLLACYFLFASHYVLLIACYFLLVALLEILEDMFFSKSKQKVLNIYLCKKLVALKNLSSTEADVPRCSSK